MSRSGHNMQNRRSPRFVYRTPPVRQSGPAPHEIAQRRRDTRQNRVAEQRNTPSAQMDEAAARSRFARRRTVAQMTRGVRTKQPCVTVDPPAAPRSETIVEKHVHHHYHCPETMAGPVQADSNAVSESKESCEAKMTPHKTAAPEPAPLCPTIPDDRDLLTLSDVFTRHELRPPNVSVLGKNYTEAKITLPDRETVKKRFGQWRNYIYLPHKCFFAYIPLYVYFCATSCALSTISTNSRGVAGTIAYKWLLNRRCCPADLSQDQDSEDQCDAESTLQSVVRLQDVDAPAFFVDQKTPVDSCYSDSRSSLSRSRCTAGLRPCDLNLTPKVCVCDSDCQGSLLSVCFYLTVVNPSPAHQFLWQIQLGETNARETLTTAIQAAQKQL